MKQRFSSLDVRVIAHELADSLIGLRLANIHDLSSKIMLFKFAKPDCKRQLIVDSGFRCHLTDYARATAASPSGFVARLRKFLRTRRLTTVAQIGTDRVLELQFGDGQYRLFLEFFAGGNVILTDRDLAILALLRTVAEGEAQEPQRVGLVYSLENRKNYRDVPPVTADRVRHAVTEYLARADSAAAAGKKINVKPRDQLRRCLAVSINELPPMLLDHGFAITAFDPATRPAQVLESDAIMDRLLQALTQARQVFDTVTELRPSAGYIFAKTRPPPAASTPGPDQGQAASAGQASPEGPETLQEQEDDDTLLLYDDFQPFLPHQLGQDPSLRTLTFDSFNRAVDEFFSSIEGQKLESRIGERELAARRKLDATKKDQATRVAGLHDAQALNIRKARAIEINIERVREAIDAITGLIDQGMPWTNIGNLVALERQRGNMVAKIFKTPLQLDQNIITLFLAEEEEEDTKLEAEDEVPPLDETDSEGSGDESDSDGEEDGPAAAAKKAAKKTAAADADSKLLEVDINLKLSAWANAREYHDQRRQAAVKEAKTVQQSALAIRNAEQKIAVGLRQGQRKEKAPMQPIRQQMWFEKFSWFISSDGYLVIASRDAIQSEVLYQRYLRRPDVYCHADMDRAATVIIRNKIDHNSTAGAATTTPIPPATLAQAGTLSVCSSRAWDTKTSMSAWWVGADQVSKTTSTGDILPPGQFSVRGTKNFLPASQLLIGIGVLFRISEESKRRHGKHRLEEGAASEPAQEPRPSEESPAANQASATDNPATENPATENPAEPAEHHYSDDDDTSGSVYLGDNIDDEKREHSQRRENPLQAGASNDGGLGGEDQKSVDVDENDDDKDDSINNEDDNSNDNDNSNSNNNDRCSSSKLDWEEEPQQPEPSTAQEAVPPPLDKDEPESDPPDDGPPRKEVFSSSAHPPPQTKKAPPKRGHRNKARKAAKYQDQDDDDRAMMEEITGVRKGREKAEAAARAQAERDAAAAAREERQRTQVQRRKQATAEHETRRKAMMGNKEEDDGEGQSEGQGQGQEQEQGLQDTYDSVDKEIERVTELQLDGLVGTPLPGDEILEAVPVCGPWTALARVKYKAKLQPGTGKKGKAVREVLDRWKADAAKRGAVDETSRDPEKMWPREVELLRGLKPEEVVNCVPVGKVAVMIGGGGKANQKKARGK